MTKFTIETVSPDEIETLQAGFIDRQVARAYAAAAEGPPSSGARADAIRAVRAALAGDGDPHAIIDSFGGVVPIAVMPLVKALLQRSSTAVSLVARAASTTDTTDTTATLERWVGESPLSVVIDDDAMFLILELADEIAEKPPARMTLVTVLNAVHVIDLPSPVNGHVQCAIAVYAEQYEPVLAALRDPETEIYMA